MGISPVFAKSVDKALTTGFAPKLLGAVNLEAHGQFFIIVQRLEIAEAKDLIAFAQQFKLTEYAIVKDSDSFHQMHKQKINKDLWKTATDLWSVAVREAQDTETIVVCGIFSTSSPIDPQKIAKDLFQNTWLGNYSTPFSLQNEKIELKIGAGSKKLAWRADRDFFSEAHLGKSAAILRPSDGSGCVSFRINDASGRTWSTSFSLREYCYASGQLSERFYGFHPRIEVPVHICLVGSSNREKMEACNRVAKASQKLEDLFLSAANTEAIRQRDELDRRRKALLHRPKIYLDGKPVALAPVNEYEVVILSQKIIELVRMYLQDYEILSYASNEGVDCIAQYRSNTNAAISESFVEYETSSSHFLDHQHPFEHIDLVVCWHNNIESEKLRRIAKGRYGSYESIKIEGDGPLYSCRIPDHNFQILALNELPELEIRRR